MIKKRYTGIIHEEKFERDLKDILAENRNLVMKYPFLYVYYSMGVIFFTIVLTDIEYDDIKLGEFKFINGEAVFEGKGIYWRFPL